MYAIQSNVVDWSEGLGVDGHKIDESRKHLLVIVNRLHTIIGMGAAHDDVSDILCALADYAGAGFLEEERMMSRSYYPEKDDHITQHWVFIERLSAIIADFERGRPVADAALAFLMHWVAVHVKASDIRFGHYLSPPISWKPIPKRHGAVMAA